MANASKRLHAAFVVTTGDNFYPDGVSSSDDSGFQVSYENVYAASSLQIPWYVSLGNHDYRGSIQAEIDYTRHSSRWKLPAPYYAQKFHIGSSNEQFLIAFIDTDPFFQSYYSDSLYRSKILKQDTLAQKHWLDSILADNTVAYKLVVGHHPCITGGKQMNAPDTRSVQAAIQPILEAHQIPMYICGHAHYLEYLHPDGPTHYFISGAGAEEKPVSLHPAYGKFAAGSYGFMTVTVRRKAIDVAFINDQNKILYHCSIARNL